MIARYRRIVDADPRETPAFRRLLDLYRERDGNVDRLVEELTARREAQPDDFAAHALLGHLYRAQNRPDEARAAYLRAMELRADDPGVRVALARVERAGGDRARARALFDEALAQTRDRLAREELLREVAQLAMDMRDFDGARAYYQQLSGGGSTSVYLRGEYARALAAAGEWELALTEYERVRASLRGDNRVLPPVLLELARAQLEAGRTDASVETLEQALRLAGAQAGIRAEIYDQMRTAYRRADRLPELAERLRAERSRGFEASALLGEIEDELGNDAAALEAYRRALAVRGRDIDTRRRVITLLMRSGRLDEVVTEYRALIRAAPREPRFVIELAQHLLQTDRTEEAMRMLRDVGRRNPRDPTLHTQLAQLYARLGMDEEANREIELLARIDPSDPAHLIALGASQLAAGERDRAIATWRRVLEVERGPGGQATLAQIFADHDLLPEAIEAYREAVRGAPERLEHVRGLAATLERARQPAEAEAAWRRVLELAADDRVARREARERIVGIWQRTSRLAARTRELAAAFRAEPPDAETGRFLAEAYRRSGPEHQARAEQVLERVVEAEPGDVESLLALERIRRARGDLAGAIEVLARLRDADARRASHYLSQMAEHALALYRDEEAVRYAAEAVRRNPDDAAAHQRLGDLYRARQDTGRAVTSYQRALELNERLYPVYFQLAELHLARSETAEADRLYRRVLAMTPDDDLVARAARASVQINLGAGTLEVLERDLLPLALGHPERPIFRRMAVELYDAYAGPLARRARRGGEGAAEAREELRRIGGRAIKPLLEALADPDPGQRRVALDILGDLGNPNAAAPLLAVAESSAIDIRERVQALRAAGAVAAPSLAGRLWALANGEDRRLRGLATWGLARVGGRESGPRLARLAENPDLSVRGYAILGLGLRGDRSRAAVVARLLERERHEDILFAATWALGRVGGLDDVPTLVAVLRSRGGELAEVAAVSLGQLGGPGAERALVGALFSPDASLRRAAARGLRRAAAETRAPELDAPPPEGFERVSAYALELARRDDGAPPLEDLARLEDHIAEAARAALGGSVEEVLAALEVLGGDDAGLALGPLVADRASWPEAARAQAEASLERLTASLQEPLLAAASHPDAAVRMAAVRILTRLSIPGAEEAVARALAGPPPSVQRAALDALAERGRAPSSEVSERLAEILDAHPRWSMRTRAARALSGTSSSAGRAALRAALAEDRYAFVREAAAEALADGLGPEDREALARAAREDPEARVRASAARALEPPVR